VIRYRDVSDAIRIANDTQYGLGAAVWSRDLDRALGAALELRAGQVWVNNYDGADFTVPWGGFKRSGQGRDKSLEAIAEYTASTTTWVQMDLARVGGGR
jgi:acyl-CoA reductase-like NAD-dependent aldehyde dehydrogenase